MTDIATRNADLRQMLSERRDERDSWPSGTAVFHSSRMWSVPDRACVTATGPRRVQSSTPVVDGRAL